MRHLSVWWNRNTRVGCFSSGKLRVMDVDRLHTDSSLLLPFSWLPMEKIWEVRDHFENVSLVYFSVDDFFLCRHSQASLKAKSFSMTLTFNFTLSPNPDQCLQRSVSLNWQIWWTTLSLGCEMVFDLLIFSHIWGFKLFKRNKKDAGLRPYVS